LKKYTVEKKLEVVRIEDDLIHCFKPEGLIPSGRDFLRNARVDAEAQALAEVLDDIDLEEYLNNDFIDDEPLEFVEQLSVSTFDCITNLFDFNQISEILSGVEKLSLPL
jgi:hypothetical protein